jgi:ABC-type Fe3+/spermidine/putrescine transport system ATPase subunit
VCSSDLLREGLRVKALNNGFNPGDRIVLAIRPEICQMDKSHQQGEKGLFGIVEKITFEGTIVRYEIRLENRDRLVINKTSLVDEWVDIGEKVTIMYPLEKVHVFAYPEAGLTEEIAV